MAFWRRDPPRTWIQKARSLVTDLWQKHRPAMLTALTVGVILCAIGIYLLAKRPGDVSNEDAFFEQADVEQFLRLGDWPTYGLTEERTRYLDADVSPPFQVKWAFKGRSLLEFAPILFNHTLYMVNKNGELFAINADRGKKRWERDIGQLSAASPAHGDELVFSVTLQPGSVVAYDKFGKKRWERDLPGRSESSPAVADHKVIVGCECGTLFAFDTETGKTVWERDVGGQIKASPAVNRGVAYVGDYSGQLTAVRIDDGSIKWQTGTTGGSFGRAGAIYATAAVAFGRVYVGSKDSRMYSFEEDSGKLAWSHSTGDEIYAGAVVADTDETSPTVYFGSYDGNFYALDAEDGSERWHRDLGTHISGAASLIGDTVYAAELQSTTTYGMSAKDGDIEWEFRDGTYNPVISDGKRLYVAGKERLYSLKPEVNADKAKSGGKKKGGKKKD
jgi:outer membrane protein assembly factor BamB